ncbi:MAG: hypothetical protein ACR2QJ_11255 [Geminicoccaceae bacterium]
MRKKFSGATRKTAGTIIATGKKRQFSINARKIRPTCRASANGHVCHRLDGGIDLREVFRS